MNRTLDNRILIGCHATPAGNTWLYYSDGSYECFLANGKRNLARPAPPALKP